VKQADCFVAAILKGLIEHNDYRRHFGSYLGIRAHLQNAIKLGLVIGDGHDGVALTDLGSRCYEAWNLASLEDCRAYFWGKKDSDFIIE